MSEKENRNPGRKIEDGSIYFCETNGEDPVRYISARASDASRWKAALVLGRLTDYTLYIEDGWVTARARPETTAEEIHTALKEQNSGSEDPWGSVISRGDDPIPMSPAVALEHLSGETVEALFGAAALRRVITGVLDADLVVPGAS